MGSSGKPGVGFRNWCEILEIYATGLSTNQAIGLDFDSHESIAAGAIRRMQPSSTLRSVTPTEPPATTRCHTAENESTPNIDFNEQLIYNLYHLQKLKASAPDLGALSRTKYRHPRVFTTYVELHHDPHRRKN